MHYIHAVCPDIACDMVEKGEDVLMASKVDSVYISNYYMDSLEKLGVAVDFFNPWGYGRL